jgi:hypothetical protein
VPVLWRWQNDECTGYNDFNAEYSQRLEQAYNSSRQQIFVIPERNWQFNFMNMTQLNPSSQSLRSIKRFVDQSIAGTSAVAAQPMQPSSVPPIHPQSTAAGHYVPALAQRFAHAVAAGRAVVISSKFAQHHLCKMLHSQPQPLPPLPAMRSLYAPHGHPSDARKCVTAADAHGVHCSDVTHIAVLFMATGARLSQLVDRVLLHRFAQCAVDWVTSGRGKKVGVRQRAARCSVCRCFVSSVIVLHAFASAEFESDARLLQATVACIKVRPPCISADTMCTLCLPAQSHGAAAVVWGADGAVGFCRRRREAASQEEGYLVLWMLPEAVTLKLLGCTSLLMQGR